MITLKLQDLELPQASLAVTSTTLVPRLNIVPERGVEFTVTELHVSCAMTFQVAPRNGKQEYSIMSAGQLIVGAVVSTIVTVSMQLAICCRQLVYRQFS